MNLFSSAKMITLAVLLVLLFVLLYYSKISHSYWQKRGVKHDKPLPVVGNNLKGFFLKKSVTQYAEEYYWKYRNDKVVGFYRGFKPELIIRDPEYVKRILIKDFTHFHSRGFLLHKKVLQRMMKNLFTVEGDTWKLIRQRVTPTFSGAKIKAMFPLIVERAEILKARALSFATEGATLDAKELMARYTIDFIGACGFGIDADSLNKEDSEFRKFGNKIFKVKTKEVLKLILKELFPETFKNMIMVQDVEDDLSALVGSVLKQRNYQVSGRGDFVDLLLECKHMGTIYGDSIEKVHSGVPEKVSLEFDDDLLVAQVFIFFAAGFETSSSSTSFTLHQLAFHPEIQQKAQKEIDYVLSKHDGKLTYDAIKEMIYLEWIFKESLRLFPPLGFLVRECAKPYYFPEINLHIDPGVKVTIPVLAMHNDPQYFQDPEVFRPERFHPDEFNSIKKQVYLPFGDGPRNCIGGRLGLMQSIAGLAALLSAFNIEPAPETIRYPEIDPSCLLVQSFKGGLPLLFKKRNL